MSALSYSCLLLILLQNLVILKAAKPGSFQLTNATCESLDLQFIQFKTCDLLRTKDGKMSFNINIRVLQKAHTILVHTKLLRQVNKKYQPFLYDDLINLCTFLQGKRHAFWGMMLDMVTKYSNLNHSCPFDHDILVKDFVFDDAKFKLFPIPKGQYLIQQTYNLNDKQRCKVQIFATKL